MTFGGRLHEGRRSSAPPFTRPRRRGLQALPRTGGQNDCTFTRVTPLVAGHLLKCHGARLHHSLTSDLSLSGEACSPFGNLRRRPTRGKRRLRGHDVGVAFRGCAATCDCGDLYHCKGRIQRVWVSNVRRHKAHGPPASPRFYLLNCIHLHGNDHLWQWTPQPALIR